MSATALQLPVEKALVAFIKASEILPSDFKIVAAHAAENLSRKEDNTPLLTGDYLAVRCDLPGGQLLGAGVSESRVEFALYTDIKDQSKVVTQTQLHSDRLSLLLDLFAIGNFLTAREALNDGPGPDNGVGFSGWEYNTEAGNSDGRTESDQLVATPKYIFEVFPL